VVTRPALILADEPTGNLDERSAAEILGVFRRIHASGVTLVIATHNPEIMAAADRALTLRDGVIVTDAVHR
jgi:ABC-type ATPase involved in cell division